MWRRPARASPPATAMTSSLSHSAALPTLKTKAPCLRFTGLYSLCAIYRLDLAEVLSWYGISLSALPGDADVIQHRPHPSGRISARKKAKSRFRIALDPGIDLSRTVFLSRLIQTLGQTSPYVTE